MNYGISVQKHTIHNWTDGGSSRALELYVDAAFDQTGILP